MSITKNAATFKEKTWSFCHDQSTNIEPDLWPLSRYIVILIRRNEQRYSQSWCWAVTDSSIMRLTIDPCPSILLKRFVCDNVPAENVRLRHTCNPIRPEWLYRHLITVDQITCVDYFDSFTCRYQLTRRPNCPDKLVRFFKFHQNRNWILLVDLKTASYNGSSFGDPIRYKKMRSSTSINTPGSMYQELSSSKHENN